MTRCPATFPDAQRHHADVRADASTGNPSTPHGRALLASGRPWPEFDLMIGECLCGSSLCFDLQPQSEAGRVVTCHARHQSGGS